MNAALMAACANPSLLAGAAVVGLTDVGYPGWPVCWLPAPAIGASIQNDQPGGAGGHDGSGAQFGGGFHPCGTCHPGGGLKGMGRMLSQLTGRGMSTVRSNFMRQRSVRRRNGWRAPVVSVVGAPAIALLATRPEQAAEMGNILVSRNRHLIVPMSSEGRTLVRYVA